MAWRPQQQVPAAAAFVVTAVVWAFSSCLADARVLDCANLSEHLSCRAIFCVCGYFGVRSSTSARHAVKTCIRHGALVLAAPSLTLKTHTFTREALASIAVIRSLLPCTLSAFNARHLHSQKQ